MPESSCKTYKQINWQIKLIDSTYGFHIGLTKTDSTEIFRWSKHNFNQFSLINNLLALFLTSSSNVFGWSDLILLARPMGNGESISHGSFALNKLSLTLHLVVLQESTHSTDTKWICGYFFIWVKVLCLPSL